MILSFGSVIISILSFVFALGLIILVHEGGHFLFARRANILCREYAFGMGPQLWKKKKGETVYSIRAFPIGGFCAIAGEETEDDPLSRIKEVRLLIENGKVVKIILDDNNDLYKDVKKYTVVEYDLFDAKDTGNLYIKVLGEDEEVIELPVDPKAMYVVTKAVKNPNYTKEQKISKYTQEVQIAPHNRTLNAKSKRARAMVMFGGPLMNFLLAIVVFFIGGLITGFADTSSSKLGDIDKDAPAYVAGLRDGDIILELSTTDTDGKIISSGELKDWNDLTGFMDTYKQNEKCMGEITVKYLSDDQEKTTTVTPMVVIYSISMLQDMEDLTSVKIGELSPQSLAYKGGLREGDIILGIKYANEDNTNLISIASWKQVYNVFANNINGDKMTISVLRDGEAVACTVDPYSKELFDKTQNVEISEILMGVSPKTKFSFGKSVVYSFTELGGSLVDMVHTLEMLFFSSEVGVGQLSGPVGIFSMTSNAAKGGFGNLLLWIGFLSVNVGFLNLLPIPALDGGRLVFVAYEAITRKKPSEKVETILISVTMILLLGLIVFVSFNDILRLLGVK